VGVSIFRGTEKGTPSPHRAGPGFCLIAWDGSPAPGDTKLKPALDKTSEALRPGAFKTDAPRTRIKKIAAKSAPPFEDFRYKEANPRKAPAENGRTPEGRKPIGAHEEWEAGGSGSPPLLSRFR